MNVVPSSIDYKTVLNGMLAYLDHNNYARVNLECSEIGIHFNVPGQLCVFVSLPPDVKISRVDWPDVQYIQYINNAWEQRNGCALFLFVNKLSITNTLLQTTADCQYSKYIYIAKNTKHTQTSICHFLYISCIYGAIKGYENAHLNCPQYRYEQHIYN